MSPTNPTTGSTMIESTIFEGRGEFSLDLLNKLKISATSPAAVRSLLKDNWEMTNDVTPALIDQDHATGAITGSHWMLFGDIEKNMFAQAQAVRLWQGADQDLQMKFDMPHLEEFPFSNTRPARNILDWADLQQMKNISMENKNTKVTCHSWEEMKKTMSELETKGLAVRLTVCMADVSRAGMYCMGKLPHME